MSASADAYNAITRLRDVFTAELKTEDLVIDPDLPSAVEVSDASFTWDTPPPEVETGKKARAKAKKAAKSKDTQDADAAREKPFEVTGIDLKIPRGSLVAIVGPVGAGKTSLLQGLIGEMRATAGTVKFGGDLAYCSQSAWIQVRISSPSHVRDALILGQNATIRENICFGRPFEEERYWKGEYALPHRHRHSELLS